MILLLDEIYFLYTQSCQEESCVDSKKNVSMSHIIWSDIIPESDHMCIVL